MNFGDGGEDGGALFCSAVAGDRNVKAEMMKANRDNQALLHTSDCTYIHIYIDRYIYILETLIVTIISHLSGVASHD